MLPSIAGIIQGVGQDVGCINVTSSSNETELEQLPLVPYFSVSIYYILLFILLCISVTAFTLLNFLGVSKSARKINLESISPKLESDFNTDTNEYNINEKVSSKNTIIEKIENSKIKKPNRNEQMLLLGIILCVSFVGMQKKKTFIHHTVLEY